MKKFAILLVLVFTGVVLSASTADLPRDTAGKSSPNTIVKNSVQLPYAVENVVVMEKVYSKDEYVLWKCPAKYVNDFPVSYITGKNFNYFVYKNGQFHMTVTEMNKESVYKFFVG
jgi:hypothetical protein